MTKKRKRKNKKQRERKKGRKKNEKVSYGGDILSFSSAGGMREESLDTPWPRNVVFVISRVFLLKVVDEFLQGHLTVNLKPAPEYPLVVVILLK